MGIFGANKKQEIEELRAEIVRLNVQCEGLINDNKTLKAKCDEITASIPKEKRDFDILQERYDFLQGKVAELEDIVKNKNTAVSQLNKQQAAAQEQIRKLKQQIFGLTEEIDMQEYGIYRPSFEFANSDLYKNKLQEIRQTQKNTIKNNAACKGSTQWHVNGDYKQGKRMVEDMKKLLLRAFNLECDDIINNVKVSNLTKSIERINKSSEQISKLGKIMQISISDVYVHYKIQELKLALDFAQKKAEEKERIKELRAQQREEAKAQKEIEEARKRLAKEQAHYQNALKTIMNLLEKDPENVDLIAKKSELEADVEDTLKAIANVDYREANKRAGYVYVISNIGAFGENIYKIGMTRRLDPMDRVNELGDASVPFNFDVHALIFTDDAPKLETALHNAFEKRKVNKVNGRREFFRVTLDEIKAVVRNNFDKTVEWTDIPEAEQYRQSLFMK